VEAADTGAPVTGGWFPLPRVTCFREEPEATDAAAAVAGARFSLPRVARCLDVAFWADNLAASSFSARAFEAGLFLAPALELEVEGIGKESEG
jgi:hypothetical protein